MWRILVVSRRLILCPSPAGRSRAPGGSDAGLGEDFGLQILDAADGKMDGTYYGMPLRAPPGAVLPFFTPKNTFIPLSLAVLADELL